MIFTSARRAQAGPILLVLVLVIGLMVVAFVGKYIKDTASEAMTKGKKETTAMDKELSTSLMFTAIYPTNDRDKNSFCGEPGEADSANKCTVDADVKLKYNIAKLILELKNTGKNPIRANQFWDMKVYVNEVPIANETEWGITGETNYLTPWGAQQTKDFALDKDCGDISKMPGGVMKIRILPPVGSSATAEITCEQCCNRQTAARQECASLCR